MPTVIADRALEIWLAQQPPYAEPDVAHLRAAGARRAAERPPGPDVARVVDLDSDGVPVRLYAPDGAAGLLVWLHGGGWTIGSIETHDALCRELAAGAGTRVLSVGYRLAPEDPWPASIDDTISVLRWVATESGELGDAVAGGRLGVGGDSAGGLLAATACQRLRELDPDAMPDVQILLSPNTDLSGETPSMREKATGFAPDARLVRFFNSQWVPDRDRWSDPAVSPLRAGDLTGLPRALVVTAEHDPLRDEGEAYARRLAEAGVTTTLRREPGVVHNPAMLAAVSPACAACLDRVVADVALLLG